ELQRMSSRPYRERILDPNDFASSWESTIIPSIETMMAKHCDYDYSVDVQAFPELSPEAVPRVIFITTDASTSAMEDEIAIRLGDIISPKFAPVWLKLQQGGVEKSVHEETTDDEPDRVCEAKNLTYRPVPCIGASIGPEHRREAGTLGGFLEVGHRRYAVTAFHVLQDSVANGNLQVQHPAPPDVEANPNADRHRIGQVTYFAPAGTLRPSLTFQGTNVPERRSRVEMDWSLFGPVENGENFVPIPTFDMKDDVVVEKEDFVTGNTEVYAMARTSGYSLGFVSDLPGFQRINGNVHREWSVRQYVPPNHTGDASLRRQSKKEWIHAGIGVPGDSGAWLMRRSDSAAVGLVWARNRNRGNPDDCVRLTYFTPIVDVIADV
ncbi:hypothetical protein QBC47DRAFT_278165, partial [Echria macrotheca]